MSVLLSLVIVAIGTSAPTESQQPVGADVFYCNFGPEWDQNFDGWPAGWTREQGRGFPRYLKVEIADQKHPGGDRCLRIELDGGGAVAYSPPIEVDSLYAYTLEGLVKTTGLVHDRAFLSVALLGANRRRVETFTSEKLGKTNDWKRLELGPWSAIDRRVRYAVIGLHLEPGEKADLKGSACFAEIRVRSLPRVALSLGCIDHLFTDPKKIEVRCNASGFTDKQLAVDFELLDEMGQPMAKVRQKLNVRPATTRVSAAQGGGEAGVHLASAGSRNLPAQQQPKKLGKTPGSQNQAPPLDGSTVWKPPVPGPGFYRIRARVKDRSGFSQQHELTLAVVAPDEAALRGCFGWSLPQGDDPLPLPILQRLVAHAGINWVKYPIWYGRRTGPEDIQQLVAFADQLNARGIELIGLLSDPPEDVRKQFGREHALLAAEVFTAPADVWYASLGPLFSRLAARVRWWQLGSDRDFSFVHYPNLANRIAEIKHQLEEAGQQVNLGIAWDWKSPPPAATGVAVPWRFLALSASSTPSAEQMAAHLSNNRSPAAQRWVTLVPMSRENHSIEQRVVNLVQRMMAAKMDGAERIFIADPFDPQTGLMNDDGTPGELLLPWRTVALGLRGRKHLGSIRLPEGSHNEVFANSADAVMVVWNDRPVQEIIHLGEEVRQVDVWGRSRTPAMQEHRQVIEVGPVPTLLVGVNGSIARWRIGFSMEKTRIPSVVDEQVKNSFQVTNGFPHEVEGTAELVIPQGWTVAPAQSPIRLAANQSQTFPFRIGIEGGSDNGSHRVRVDFEIRAGQVHRFSVYEQMDLGLGEVYIKVSTRMNDQGELVVQQQFINETDERVSFSCQLFAPNRIRQATRVLQLAKGTNSQEYRLPKGKELIGETLWLQATEVGGSRVLNYRFPVK